MERENLKTEQGNETYRYFITPEALKHGTYPYKEDMDVHEEASLKEYVEEYEEDTLNAVKAYGYIDYKEPLSLDEKLEYNLLPSFFTTQNEKKYFGLSEMNRAEETVKSIDKIIHTHNAESVCMVTLYGDEAYFLNDKNYSMSELIDIFANNKNTDIRLTEIGIEEFAGIEQSQKCLFSMKFDNDYNVLLISSSYFESITLPIDEAELHIVKKFSDMQISGIQKGLEAKPDYTDTLTVYEKKESTTKGAVFEFGEELETVKLDVICAAISNEDIDILNAIGEKYQNAVYDLKDENGESISFGEVEKNLGNKIHAIEYNLPVHREDAVHEDKHVQETQQKKNSLLSKLSEKKGIVKNSVHKNTELPKHTQERGV